MTWLNYFLIYCCNGAIFLLAALFHKRFIKAQGDSPGTGRSVFKLDYQEGILERFLVPLLGFTLALIGWPVLVYCFIKEHWFPALPHAEKIFAVERAHLGVLMSQEDIEALERVHDPMRAVPDLPFGHLNAAWLDFLVQLSEGDVLWTFSATWQGDWGDPEDRAGYVIVHENLKIGSHFLMRLFILDTSTPSQSVQSSGNRYDIPEFLRKVSD